MSLRDKRDDGRRRRLKDTRRRSMKDVETRVGLGDGRFESCTVTMGKVMGDGGIFFMVI